MAGDFRVSKAREYSCALSFCGLPSQTAINIIGERGAIRTGLAVQNALAQHQVNLPS
jgi:hypothetical protein